VPYRTGLGLFGAVLKYLTLALGVGLSVGIWILSRDIVRRRRAEEALWLSREELRSLAAHLQSIREDERGRMARDMHDELGRTMTAMKVGLSWLQKQIARFPGLEDTAALDRIMSLNELADATVKWVRRTAAELRPQVLDDLGIVAALEWQADEFRKRMGIRCNAHLPENELRLEPEQATALFRICQESLTNVARYAGATRVDVTLRLEDSTVTLEVQDNGKGIPKESLAGKGSFGILGMRERARAVGGEFEIHGLPGIGTTVIARTPLASRKATQPVPEHVGAPS